MNQQSSSFFVSYKQLIKSVSGLFVTIKEYKLFIIIFTVLISLVAVYAAKSMPTIYKAEVLMMPAKGVVQDGSLAVGLDRVLGRNSNAGVEGEKALAILQTRKFLTKYIRKNNLKPILFASQWKQSDKSWINREPSDAEAFYLFSRMVSAASHPKSKANISSIWVTWEDPVDISKVSYIANQLAAEINAHERRNEILNAKKSIAYIKNELRNTDIIAFQTILNKMLEEQMSRIMFANVGDDFIFKVIDPAVETRPLPKRTIPILLFGGFLGIFFSIVLSLGHQQFKLSQEE